MFASVTNPPLCTISVVRFGDPRDDLDRAPVKSSKSIVPCSPATTLALRYHDESWVASVMCTASLAGPLRPTITVNVPGRRAASGNRVKEEQEGKPDPVGPVGQGLTVGVELRSSVPSAQRKKYRLIFVLLLCVLPPRLRRWTSRARQMCLAVWR